MLSSTSRYLNDLVGKKVSVFCMNQSGSRDDGILDGFDGVCIRIRKETKGGEFETYVFPITSVRLLKPME